VGTVENSECFYGEFSKRCGNRGKIVFYFSTVPTARQFPQLSALIG
jgi:hypothetical protein